MSIHPPARSNRAHMSKASGFTLLEVIAAMALIGLIVGGVYSVGAATVKLGASMNTSRIFETRITNFVTAWREYLETLPAGITFSAKDGKLFIENGTVPFAWTRAVRRADAVEFAIASSSTGSGGDFLVRHLKKPQRPTAPDEFKLVAELPLLENLRAMDWQFYEPQKKEWTNTWDSKKRPTPPLYMRMKFSFLNNPRDFEYTFWVANDLVTPQNPQQPTPGQPQQIPPPRLTN